MNKNTRNVDVEIKMKGKGNMKLENNYAGNLNGVRLVVCDSNMGVRE